MKAKHRVLAAGMAAAMTLSLAACGGSASTAEPTASSTVEAAAPEATSEAASGDVTEVTWWTYFGDKNIGYLQNIIDDFNNSQNQYHVTIVYQGNQMECNAKLQSTEKENLPAMFSGAVEDVAMYANSDFCVPLQKYVDADTEGWQELDDTWDALRSAYSDGQGNLIGYPIGYSYPNIFYNADLLKKAGVDPASIQSFDDLYDASKTIVDGGFATYGIGFFANGAMFNVALGREGVQAYNNENGLNGQPVTECLYDSDTTVHDSIYNMLSIYQKMGAEKLCVPYGADYQSEIIPQIYYRGSPEAWPDVACQRAGKCNDHRPAGKDQRILCEYQKVSAADRAAAERTAGQNAQRVDRGGLPFRWQPAESSPGKVAVCGTGYLHF